MAVTQGGFETVVGSGISRRVNIKTPAAPSATATKAAIPLTGAAQNGISAGITQPDVPRNITVKGNAAGIAGNVTIHGTSVSGQVITEVIALNGANEVVGNKAFKTVTSIDYPVQTNGGTDTVSIGRGSKLGIGFKLSRNTFLFAFLNNVKEAVAPTLALSGSAVESNTVLLNSAIPGAQDVDFYFIED